MNKKEAVPYGFPNSLMFKYGLLPSDLDPFSAYSDVPNEYKYMPVESVEEL